MGNIFYFNTFKVIILKNEFIFLEEFN